MPHPDAHVPLRFATTVVIAANVFAAVFLVASLPLAVALPLAALAAINVVRAVRGDLRDRRAPTVPLARVHLERRGATRTRFDASGTRVETETEIERAWGRAKVTWKERPPAGVVCMTCREPMVVDPIRRIWTCSQRHDITEHDVEVA